MEANSDFSKNALHKKELEKILYGNDQMREVFLREYSFFNSDENKSVYIKWILEHIEKGKLNSNIVISHIFEIAMNIDYFSQQLLKYANLILKNRYYEETKLSCLDYINTQKDKIKITEFQRINELAIISTRNEIIKFQSYINLLNTNNSCLKYIKNILEQAKYPTLFYRLGYQFSSIPNNIKSELKLFIKAAIETQNFSEDVKKELRKIYGVQR